MIGIKHDQKKPRYDLVPWRVFDDVVKVITYGADEYGETNWQHVEPHRYWAAGSRHLTARMRGKLLDEKTGLPHLAHAAVNMLFAAWHDLPEDERQDDTRAYAKPKAQ